MLLQERHWEWRQRQTCRCSLRAAPGQSLLGQKLLKFMSLEVAQEVGLVAHRQAGLLRAGAQAEVVVDEHLSQSTPHF
jgi:hypothetical protein